MRASLETIEATDARWWVTEAMVRKAIGRHRTRGDASLTAEELAAELLATHPDGMSAADRELVVAQVVGRLRDLADAGKLTATADYSQVLASRTH